jgi:prevent-host-death family protein
MTKLKNIISTTTARRNFFQLTEEVQKPGNYFTLTQKGEAKAVLVSYDEYESMVETLEVIRENPRALKDIKLAQSEFARGDYKIWEPKPVKTYTSSDANYAVAEKGA